MIASVEGDSYYPNRGDIVQVLSSNGGFLGTLAYIDHFTKIGRINGIMPSKNRIRTFKAKYIRYVCREEDEFGLLFHQQHETLRWQDLVNILEHEAGGQLSDSDGNSHEGSVGSMHEEMQYDTVEMAPQDTSSAVAMKRSENHCITAVLGVVCTIL
mmetsp:Transcript_1621/g.2497  ORF Transcript_1621/g.2497 Transcript_1621/m.2497 type:complete len:156 (-) Transcript_1621:305-772(-)